MIVITAKHRRVGNTETVRFTNEALSHQDAVARAGAWLHSLGWEITDIKIMGVRVELADAITTQVRNRMIAPDTRSLTLGR